MTRTITALFDNRDAADKAKSKLADAGVRNVNVTAQGAGYDDMSTGTSTSTGSAGTLTGSADPVRDVSEGDYGERGERGGSGGSGGGLWASIKNMFSDEDRPTYEEGLRRGHFLLTAQVDDDLTDDAIRILEDSDAVDVDQRAEEWRSAGWTGAPNPDRTDMPPATPAVAGHVGDDRITGHHGDDELRGAATDDEVRLGETDQLRGAGRDLSGDQRIDIVEERLRVGKREVERGGVRVRSYVVETPVHEQVSLHEEHVSVERRPVDRALSGATDGDLFRDRTIEVTEHAEEAVVAKEARVVEELVVRKEAEDRTETINDTVRRTEVDVDDTRRTGLTGETRAFSSTDTTDAGLDPTTGTIPGETDEQRRRRLAEGGMGAGAGTTPTV